jgi:hypothetical protein
VRFLISLGLAILVTATFVAPTFARGGGRGGGVGGLVSVRGHYRANGTYVAPYVRTRPDGIPENNLSYRGGTYRSPEPALATTAVTTSHPLIAGDGPQSIPGPTTWTDTGPSPKAKEPWCVTNRVVGTGAGFCIIN